MKAKLLIGLATSALLFGCATNPALEAQIDSLTNKVDSLSDQVGTLSADHSQMSSDTRAARMAAEDAQAEAARANARIDNMATGYRK